jgi:hypothetical protein
MQKSVTFTRKYNDVVQWKVDIYVDRKKRTMMLKVEDIRVFVLQLDYPVTSGQ